MFTLIAGDHCDEVQPIYRRADHQHPQGQRARRIVRRTGPVERRDRTDFLPLEGQVQRHGSFGGQAPVRAGDRECPTEEAVGGKRPRQCRAQRGRLGKVVTPEAKRRAVKHLVIGGWLCQRRACRLLGLARPVARYQAIPRDDALLRTCLQALATGYPRYGYLLLHALLRQEGLVINAQAYLPACTARMAY